MTEQDICELFPSDSPGRSAAEALISRATPSLLAGDPLDPAISEKLAHLDGASLFGQAPIFDPALAEGARAGLLLWNDDFEASHRVAQDISNVTGSYWHGVCHRREGHRGAGLASNMDNTRYWFRRVSSHPIFPALYGEALALLQAASPEMCEILSHRGSWDPFLFIDWIQACEEGANSDRRALEAIQAAEMKLLLEYSARGARETRA
ncbi:MAG TPA: hypothetical protein VFJ58_25455 [Armatimonadota bacterium]|nr:hypothetical protein [Armatimonadota bacterium]